MSGTLEINKWYLVCPTPTTINLITNPSIETGTASWPMYGSATLSQSVTKQSHGVYSLKVIPASGSVAGGYYEIALVSGSQYVFSCDIYTIVGQQYNLQFGDAASVLKGTANTWTGNGYWQRREVTYSATATATHRLHFWRTGTASVTPFYADGFQLEAGSVATTYIDGDQKGFVPNEVAYYWSGTRHASSSYRDAQTRAGGSLLDLDTVMVIKNVSGLGMVPVSNSYLDSTLQGSYYQNTIAKDRTLIISGDVTNGQDDGVSPSEGVKAGKLKQLIDAIQFDRVKTKQPMLLRYVGVDSTGQEYTETVQMKVNYAGGLERAWENNFADEVSLNFRACSPEWENVNEQAIDCGYQYVINGANYILKRDGNTGQWGTLGTGMDDDVRALKLDTSGNLYAGGEFGTAGGVVCAKIAKWTGAAWGSLGSGMNNVVRNIVIDSSGTLYAGGGFGTAGGVVCNRIAKWDGDTWGSLGSGMSDDCYALAIDQSGNIYTGGVFGTAGGVVCNRIAKWDGDTWGSLGSGMNASIFTLAINNSGTLYAGGGFGTAGGVVCNRIAKWDGDTWGSLGSGMSGGGGIVYSILQEDSGNLCAVGDFILAGGGTVNNITKWNGSNWIKIGDGTNGRVFKIKNIKDGAIVTGEFLTINNSYIYGNVASIDKNIVRPLSVKLSNNTIVYSTEFNNNTGDLYIGFDTSGTAYSCVNSTPSCGGAVAYPFFEVTGPGTLYTLENYNTKTIVQFDNLFVNSGEIVRIDFDPIRPRVWSNTRDNLMSYLLPGSNMNLKLLPSTNNIDVFMYGGTDANSKALMRWRDVYWSVDQAKH
jgi:hypothetical protein